MPHLTQNRAILEMLLLANLLASTERPHHLNIIRVHTHAAVIFYFGKNYYFIYYSVMGRLIIISFQFQFTNNLTILVNKCITMLLFNSTEYIYQQNMPFCR